MRGLVWFYSAASGWSPPPDASGGVSGFGLGLRRGARLGFGLLSGVSTRPLSSGDCVDSGADCGCWLWRVSGCS